MSIGGPGRFTEVHETCIIFQSGQQKKHEPIKYTYDLTNNELNNNTDKCCDDSKKKEKPTPSKMKNNNNDESEFYSPPPTIKDMKIPRPLQLTRSPSIDTPKRSLYHEFSALLSPVTTTNDVDASINQCALKLKNLDLSCR